MNIDSAIAILLETEKDWSVDNEVDAAAGTHLIGKISITFQELYDLLGHPAEGTALAEDNRVWWNIFWDDGVGATVYEYNKYPTPVKQVEEWNIGSTCNADEVMERLEKIIGTGR